MSDISLWLSYSLSDFIMFDAQTFLRLFERINQDLGGWILVSLIASFALSWTLVFPTSKSMLVARLTLSSAWFISGYGFLINQFGPINEIAIWAGAAFIVQAALTAGLALFEYGRDLDNQNSERVEQEKLSKPERSNWLTDHRLLVLTLWFTAIALLPWIVPLQTGEMESLAWFGIEPHLTGAIAALNYLLLPVLRQRWLALIPLLWSLVSAVSLWVLQLHLLLIYPLLTLILAIAILTLGPYGFKGRIQ